MNFGSLSLPCKGLLGSLALVVLWGVGKTWASCGAENCPLDLSGHAGLSRTAATPRLNLQMGFEAIDQDQLWAGADKVRFGERVQSDHNELETRNQNLRLVANYVLNPRWSFRAGIPFLHRSHSHLAQAGHHEEEEDQDRVPETEGERELEEWNFASLGDVAVWGRYHLGSSRRPGAAQLVAGVGLSLPTGRTDVRNEHGELAEPSLQPGRGAVGVLFECSVQHGQLTAPTLSGRGALHLFASTLYQLNLRGKAGYQFGDEWLLHAGGQYALFRRLDLLGQFVARWRDKDAPGNTDERVDATGGTFLYLSPGLQVKLVQPLSLYGYYQVPIRRHVNAVQLTAGQNVFIGLSYNLL